MHREGEDRALTVSSERENGTYVLRLSGELDLANVEELKREIDAAQTSGAERIVIDLTALQFIDSSGLHLFLRAQDAARNGSRRLAFVRGPGHVDRVLRVSGIERQLEWVE